MAFPNTGQGKSGSISIKAAGPNPAWSHFRECVSIMLHGMPGSSESPISQKQSNAPAAPYSGGIRRVVVNPFKAPYRRLNLDRGLFKNCRIFRNIFFNSVNSKLLQSRLKSSPLQYFRILLKYFKYYCDGGNLDRSYLHPPPLLSQIGKGNGAQTAEMAGHPNQHGGRPL